MPQIEFRFDLAAILFASVLTVLGLTATVANAGGASGGVLGDAKKASSEQHPTAGPRGDETRTGGRGG